MPSRCYECRFAEEQEPSGRLILGPCLVCANTALDALEQLQQELTEARRRMQAILNVIYGTHGYMINGEIDNARKYRAIERLARLDWDDDGFSDPV